MRKIIACISLLVVVLASSTAWAAAPRACSKLVNWPSNFLYKSDASGHLAGDIRYCCPTIVCGHMGGHCGYNPFHNRVNILAPDGTVLAFAVPYGGNDPRGPYAWRAYVGSGSIKRSGATILRIMRQKRADKAYLQLAQGSRSVCAILPIRYVASRIGYVRH